MLSNEEIKVRLEDIEADNIERTVSTRDTDKFCKAICAFAIATEQDERILTERRTHKARSFDLQPCVGCDEDQMALSLFQLGYRNAAIAPEIIEENHRDIFQQMAALGFWDMQNNCATNAGALLFAESPRNWLPGAYIQYVRFDGTTLADDVLDERQFNGDLNMLLRELDGFLRTLFPSRPIPVSALREKQITPYPIWAIRELLMNAVMHRDYQSNAPVMFYWFSDRIEIQNPGGLYGAATVDTFPDQNDYRNPKIAEAMKVMKYVNMFSHGIANAQSLLKKNGNPLAEFTIEYPTYFLATVRTD